MNRVRGYEGDILTVIEKLQENSIILTYLTDKGKTLTIEFNRLIEERQRLIRCLWDHFKE